MEGDVEASAFTGRDGEARATLELTATTSSSSADAATTTTKSDGESNVPEIGGDDSNPLLIHQKRNRRSNR